MSARIHALETKVIQCDSCKGSGETQMNDFSDPYQVTQYDEKCFTCGGHGELEVVESVVYHCPRCGKEDVVDNFHLSAWISSEDKKSVEQNGFIERMCDEC